MAWFEDSGKQLAYLGGRIVGGIDRGLNGLKDIIGKTFAGSFRLDKQKERPIILPVKPARWLLKETYKVIKQEWRLFLGIGLIYAVIYAYIAIGSPGLNIAALRSGFEKSRVTGIAQIAGTAGAALDGSIQTNATNGPFFATFLTITFALATIWAVRHIVAGHAIRIRDALYNGTVSFISTCMLLLLLFLQMLPATLGVFLYITARGDHVLTGGVVDMVMFLVVALLILLSLYWLASTSLALIAVTLPGVYPSSALRAAKDLAAYRRWHIIMRLIVYTIVMGLIWIVVISLTVSNPITVVASGFILNMLRGFTMITAVVYMYKLYRSLVDETDEQVTSKSKSRKAT